MVSCRCIAVNHFNYTGFPLRNREKKRKTQLDYSNAMLNLENLENILQHNDGNLKKETYITSQRFKGTAWLSLLRYINS